MKIFFKKLQVILIILTIMNNSVTAMDNTPQGPSRLSEHRQLQRHKGGILLTPLQAKIQLYLAERISLDELTTHIEYQILEANASPYDLNYQELSTWDFLDKHKMDLGEKVHIHLINVIRDTYARLTEEKK